MVDVPMAMTVTAGRAPALRRFSRNDNAFHLVTRIAAWFVLVILGGVIATLVVGSIGAFAAFGPAFFVDQIWNPATEKFGALVPIYGTLLTSLIAMLIAVPIGIGIAIFLTELCPIPLRRPIGIAIELLAGIPSIIYGMWGFFVLRPVLQGFEQTWIAPTLSKIPVLGALFRGPASGYGMLTAGIILAIMILPFIAAITRDVFASVPTVLKEAAYGLGCTTREVMGKVVLPYSKVGVVGGMMLALGRALGETMAVTFVIGNSHRFSASLLYPSTTISATIASEFAEAKEDLYSSSLFALGLILFVITFIVLSAARLMLARMNRRAGA
jgi:phosphate transport system permease protein